MARIVNTEEFDLVVSSRIKRIQQVLNKKAAEYSKPHDRMHNFNWAAQLDEGQTTEEALWGMMKKHLASVHDLVHASHYAPASITEELIDEKIGDSINYLILLEASLLRLVKDSAST